MYSLAELELLKVKQEEKDEKNGTFIFEPFVPGYGMTIGNALRRVLLSSLGGAATTSVKIEGVTHEFSNIPGVKEDVVEVILKLKSLRIKLLSDGPETLRLCKKGPGPVKAKDFNKNAHVKIIDGDFCIANLDNKGKLEMEITIEKGKGYVPTENRKEQKLPLGYIAIDSIFTPIKKVHYEVENTRVGGLTNYDKLTMNISTDGTITPQNALKSAAQILIEHFQYIKNLGQIEAEKNLGEKTLIKGKKTDLKVKKENVALVTKKTKSKQNPKKTVKKI